ncbi:MAG: hypothetical protein NWR39_01870 [Pseudomonadota bacterium]|nr:hypothetical protein [Pseudomonadota bacterium]
MYQNLFERIQKILVIIRNIPRRSAISERKKRINVLKEEYPGTPIIEVTNHQKLLRVIK